MNFNQWLETRIQQPVVLYHGTLRKLLAQIQQQGLKPSVGWGGADTEGVYLSKTTNGALYWAKLAYQNSIGGRLEADRFDRNNSKQQNDILVVLRVNIPYTHVSNLRADMEQAEDYGFDGDELDWQASLQQIGDVRYEGVIPSAWIQVVS